MIELQVRFRSGWQQPFRDGDQLVIYGRQREMVGVLPGALLFQLIAHYLTGAQLHAELSIRVADPERARFPLASIARALRPGELDQDRARRAMRRKSRANVA